MVIHTRNAWQDVLPIFTEQHGQIERSVSLLLWLRKRNEGVLDAGYFISFTGVVTFKDAKALNIAANYVPLDRFVGNRLPLHGARTIRGKRCEPAHVPYIAQKIAEVKKIDCQTVSQTNLNVENCLK